jgi:hypothetical protein
MKEVTLREYARMHKLSYFNVMKMVRNGDVKSVTKIENNKEVYYVLVEEEQEKRVRENIIETSSKSLTLEEENRLLKEEIVRLKEALERCNKRTVLA